MKQIPLSHGKFAIVDDEDFPYLSRFTWVTTDNKTGSTNVGMNVPIGGLGGTIVRVPMWRFLLKPAVQRKIIFLNRNPLDHRKENLKLASPSEFNAHSGKRVNNEKRGEPTSRFKGVSFSGRGRKKWIMTIQFEGKEKSKCFSTEEDAALAYNEKSREYYGELAYQNDV